MTTLKKLKEAIEKAEAQGLTDESPVHVVGDEFSDHDPAFGVSSHGNFQIIVNEFAEFEDEE